jgi:hypothetical protein
MTLRSSGFIGNGKVNSDFARSLAEPRDLRLDLRGS